MGTSLRRLLIVVSNQACIQVDKLNAVSEDHYEIRQVKDIESAFKWVASPYVAACIVHASIGDSHAAEFFGRLNQERSEVPLLYLASDVALLSGFGTVLPEAVVHEPVDHASLSLRISEMLSCDVLAGALLDVTIDSLMRTVTESFIPDATADPLRLRAGQVPVHAINATLPFCGPSVSGRITLSANPQTIERVYSRLLPSRSRVTTRELEDLLGEMSNQLLGGLKRVMSAGGLDFALGVPMMYTGPVCPVRFRSRRGAVLLNLRGTEHPTDRLAVGLSLNAVRREFERGVSNDDAEAGELAFF